LRAARLQAIKADIRASLGEQGLSPTAAAARQGVMRPVAAAGVMHVA
jgi:hypothetical protein